MLVLHMEDHLEWACMRTLQAFDFEGLAEQLQRPYIGCHARFYNL